MAHESSIFHRDIRWDNVLRKREEPTKWFLIDWEDSSIGMGVAAPHFNKETHSPDVFKNGHGAEVDIWGVGFLMSSCKSSDITPRLKEFGREICNSSKEFSAEKVLEGLGQFR